MALRVKPKNKRIQARVIDRKLVIVNKPKCFLECPVLLKSGTSYNYKRDVADIPECREKSSLDDEYRDFPEEKIWTPNEEVNKWVSFYVFMARAVLTYVQESQGIPHGEALENSCTGDAEQYITDVLHDSNYLPDVALKTLLTQKLPQKLISRWTDPDVVSDTITSDTTIIYKSSDATMKTAL
ncbi:uncharacterized protein LOC143361710 [Halictus rubicundus]|uniref:uncharacterized protein LOC143361710 n=1 Tax=Halictus rubicundus TaxID=77578 RepID=UPI0040353EB1